MKIRMNRIAAVGLAGVLAFGLTACDDGADDEGTTVIEEDEAPADSGDTTVEEGDDTDVTVEDEEAATEDAATDTATEDAATDETATEDAEG